MVGFNSLVGGVAGVASYGAGQWATNNLGNSLINALNVTSPVGSGAINGLVGAAAGGYAGGLLFSGGDLNAGFEGGWNGLKTGAAIGGGVGVGTGYLNAKFNNLDPWSGKATGRTESHNLSEQIAMAEAKLGQGTPIMEGKMNDSFWKY